jgi:hypothetical protein
MLLPRTAKQRLILIAFGRQHIVVVGVEMMRLFYRRKVNLWMVPQPTGQRRRAAFRRPYDKKPRLLQFLLPWKMPIFSVMRRASSVISWPRIGKLIGQGKLAAHTADGTFQLSGTDRRALLHLT